ncbi:probable YMC1 - Protein of the mitochondrial carrier family (MCF) [Melanopsichium pennsylvanicum]|uniref:Probable YMC1 - Protein of the mitochondrial carrier family (MCF) n=2 Tax=Melanopsichium pennsylvanicum TaxID=63383 RepID=A0AAJ4XP46_9BASI|nr:probable YMC1-Protein of the mitochondrial carrier family (MCF) [Melanopsichium pennsylvanicum 4]SNX84593.1 probable YMC1 - Protein of the mitochondrial carrier family (MCF) [Melanopsichium pennsylvanicum]
MAELNTLPEDPLLSSTQRTSYLSQGHKDVLAGTFGGIAQVLVGQPLDIIKVRLQTSPPGTYTGMVDCATRIVTNEGPLAFYKGTLTPLLGVGACVSIQFGVVESLKRYFSSSNKSQGKGQGLSYGQFYLAGGIAGVANSFVAGPVEHVRIRLQTQPFPPLYRGPVDCIRQITTQSGLFNGVFRGQIPTFAREFHGMGMYFLTYEALVQYKLEKDNLKRDQLPNTYAMFAGAMAGYGLWLTAYPADIIKSKLQTDSLNPNQRRYKGTLDCIKQTLKQDGVKGLFRGLLPTLVRSPFANAATFVAFEWAARNLKNV